MTAEMSSTAALKAPLEEPLRRTFFLVAEEVGSAPDEGYAKVGFELGNALKRHASVVTHVTRQGVGVDPDSTADSRARLGINRMRAVLSRRLWAELRQARPATVVYMSRSSITLTALLRARLLKWMGGKARVVMIGLQPRRLGLAARLMSRLLWPDLLLVSTEAEVRGTRRLGATVERMVTGVDLARFRPARPGEKQVLRRKFGIPEETRVVLHVGHLTGGRNLEALLPLAAQPDTTVVVVTSSQREAESGRLEDTLRAHGIVLIQGYLADIDEVYRLADCYVFPTVSTDYAIAMPLSILEAMASDLPVAAMRFGALPERFGDVEGVLLVNSSGELVDAVAKLRRQAASTRHLSEGYSWDSMAQQVASI
jgi:glycosyltransferase involved in cell wall biosynthesis